jgi:uncharacterized protein YjdB
MSGREQHDRARPYHGAMTYATRSPRLGIALAVLAVLGWLGGCSDGNGPVCCDPPQGLIISDPVPGAAVASGVARTAPVSSAGDDVAYVSLTPGTSPTGATATIRRLGHAGSITTSVRDGGFDPVSVGAEAGDSIEVEVRNAAQVTVGVFGLTVEASRPPVVVRTQPPRKKTDVPLNSAIVVVFSEPIAGATPTASSIRLLRGQTVVSGTPRFLDSTLDASHVSVEFVPDSPLAAGTAYHLVVTTLVRDVDGDGLAASQTVTFRTGQSSAGAPASIETSPDSALRGLSTGATYQVTASVRDAAGNQLTDHPASWSSSDSAIVAVSPTGLLEARADGFAIVTASVGGLSDQLYVFISPNLAASVVVSPSSATVAQGSAMQLVATVRDTEGRLINHPEVSWSTSDGAVATVMRTDQTRGIVTGVSLGSVTITATCDAASGTAEITVGAPAPVASVTVNPDSLRLVPGAAVLMTVTLRDADGNVLSGRAVTWGGGNAAVATVDRYGIYGRVTVVGIGSTSVVATSEGVSDTAAVTVVAPPMGHDIAFARGIRDIPGTFDIMMMHADGSGISRFTQSGGDDTAPEWSPDGTKIAFASNRDGNAEIYVMNADGSGVTRLTNHTADDLAPLTWSPDGAKIAFTSNRDGNYEIYAMTADGSGVTRLSNNAVVDATPAWSPDGSKIAFSSERDGNREIYMMNANGSGVIRLTNHPAFDSQPTWAPDGTRIAFVSGRDGNSEIYVMNADGGGVTRLTNRAASDEFPAWSPDGSLIAFYSDWDIYLVNADGSGLFNLTNHFSQDDHTPSWRP